MGNASDPFERARRESNPVERARLAGELITVYQQRSVELARLRREAINEAVDKLGTSFSAVATQLGLTRGRVSQIRKDAPPPERAFFGVGPVTIAVPLRAAPDRALPVISPEDSRAAERLAAHLTDLTFQVSQYRIPTSGAWEPHGDTVAICGPKSSDVTADAIASDPILSFAPDPNGRWVITERATGTVFASPMDQTGANQRSDIAYIGRLPYRRASLLVVAGVHALGSVGAIDYLARRLPDLYADVGTSRFSAVIRSSHVGATVVETELVCPPRIHGPSDSRR